MDQGHIRCQCLHSMLLKYQYYNYLHICLPYTVLKQPKASQHTLSLLLGMTWNHEICIKNTNDSCHWILYLFQDMRTGAILEISLRVGIVLLNVTNVTPQHVFWPFYSVYILQSTLSAVFWTNFAEIIAFDWFQDVKYHFFCQKMFSFRSKGGPATTATIS